MDPRGAIDEIEKELCENQQCRSAFLETLGISGSSPAQSVLCLLSTAVEDDDLPLFQMESNLGEEDFARTVEFLRRMKCLDHSGNKLSIESVVDDVFPRS